MLQFDIFDPVKIHSTPGVRSDLFHRPLHQTLVTDFFGGVSQAEVLPPLLSSNNTTTTSYNKQEHQSPTSQHVSVKEDVSDFPSTGKAYDTELLALVDSQVLQNTERGAFLRTLQAWSSIGLVGVLVGWVGFRARRKD